jgi:hypothetical protein
MKTEEVEGNKWKEKDNNTKVIVSMSSSCLFGSEEPYSKNLSSLKGQACDTEFPKYS